MQAPPSPRRLDGLARIPARPAPTPAAPSRPVRRSRIRVRKAALLYVVVAAYLYIVAAPYAPSLLYYFHSAFASRAAAQQLPPTPAPLASLADMPAPGSRPTPVPIPGPNTLKIGSIGVDGQIYEGQTEATLSKGIWHRPNTSTPDKGGNTVLAAHRFMYLTGGNTFYNLDKVSVGDLISVAWNGKEYDYQIYNTEVVASDQVSIENNTANPILTLYTCTPLWTSQKRLVVQANLIRSQD